MAPRDWTQEEIDTVVESYFRMLRAELLGVKYVKVRENEWVRSRVRDRSKQSVEFKYQNISAALLQLGSGAFVRGYKPMKNLQSALLVSVAQRLQVETGIEQLMIEESNRPLEPQVDLVWSVAEAPDFLLPQQESRRAAFKIDFLQLEARNRELGLAGEQAIVERERALLRRAGQKRLAERVEHVSVTQGDGLGYDIHSFDPSGAEKYIEVKTTRRAREYPFLVSRNEVQFSSEASEQFDLVRVFDFGRPAPGLFVLHGSIEQTCQLAPREYVARARVRS